MSELNRVTKHNNANHTYRNLKKIGKRNCNLCKKEFDIYSKFDRFCMICKHGELYKGYFL